MGEHCVFLRAGDLTAIVGDDTPRGPGGRQYSGLWSLLHKDCAISPFQNAYAGLIAGTHRGTEPALEPVDDSCARLVRTPCERQPHAEVRGTYRLVPPHYVDYTYEVRIPRDAVNLPECLVHSWCSYMNSPLDRSIHFIENNVWTTLLPVIHGEAATVFPTGLDDDHRHGWEKRTGEARFAQQGNNFHESFSGRTFDFPMYFGVIHGMVWLLMADHHRDFRFYISPSGAGPSAAPGLSSPAWDFLWLNWNPMPGETRVLHIRLAFCIPPGYMTNAGVWREWEQFRQLHPTQ